MLDLTPATDQLAAIVHTIDDVGLADPTPCEALTIGDILQHVDGLAEAFARAARKQPQLGGPTADGANLTPEWRKRIPTRLADLSAAWNSPQAWDGMTEVGGLSLPGSAAGAVAATELVVHGWDLATASHQRYHPDQTVLELAYTFVQPTAAQHPKGSPGLFGPVVNVPDDATLLDRLLGMTGRDPGVIR